MEEQQQQGIFVKQKINFRPADEVTHLVAANNVLILVLANNTIRRIPLQNSEKQCEIEVARSTVGDRIAAVHMDPSGQHVWLSTRAGDNFYLNNETTKLKAVGKAKGCVITAVGWNQEFTRDDNTGFILLGTSKGVLYETQINQSGTLQYWKQVYALSPPDEGDRSAEVDDEASRAICGIELHRCLRPPTRLAVLVSTAGCLFPFAGEATTSSGAVGCQQHRSTAVWVVGAVAAAAAEPSVLNELFLDYKKNPGRVHTLDPCPPKDGPSRFSVYPMVGDDPPERFAWLTAAGVKYGRLDTSAGDAFKMTVDDELLLHSEVNGRPELPVDLALTEFHMLLLYEDRLVAVSPLNQQITYEDYFKTKFGTVKGLSRDSVSGLIWLFTDRSVLKYRPVDEARHVWRIYLDRGDFSSARKYAGADSDALDVVLRTEAAQLFSEKKYVAAAEIFAMSNCPFDETTLKFVEIENKNGLRTFLERRLDILEPAVCFSFRLLV